MNQSGRKQEDNSMSIDQQNESAGSNQYVQGSICNHCAGFAGHEPWCITRNAIVRYAFGLVVRASLLTLQDELILHALGVQWSPHGL
jgi:hypothetical protein